MNRSRRKALASIGVIGCAGVGYFAFANAPTKKIAVVYDAVDTLMPASIARIADRAGGESSLLERGFEYARYPLRVGDTDGLSSLVASFASTPPTIAVVIGDDEVLAVRQALPSTPMIFWCNTDPEGSGIVESYVRPGKLASGATGDWVANVKPLEYLSEGLLPARAEVAVVASPFWFSERRMAAWSNAAERLALNLTCIAVSSMDDLQRNEHWIHIEKFAAVILPISTTHVANMQVLVDYLNAKKVLAMFESFIPVIMGAPLGYEHTLDDWADPLGIALGLVVDGYSPSDIPVRGPDGWRWAANPTALGALSITLPPTLAATISSVF